MTETEMTGLLLQLADLGVTGIRVHYEGSGDSGAIEDITYTTQKINDPSNILDLIEWDSDEILNELNPVINDKIHDWVENKLLQDIENWWDNEGGHGEVCICVPSGRYCIYNNVRIIEYEEYTHDGNVINKTLK